MAFPRIAEKAKRPRPGVPFKKDVVIRLLTETYGNISRSAEAIGTSRSSLRRYIDANPDVKEILKDQRERRVDDLESSVWDRAISGQDSTIQIFLLKTQARDRGYDQVDDSKKSAQDIATAAFEYVISRQSQS